MGIGQELIVTYAGKDDTTGNYLFWSGFDDSDMPVLWEIPERYMNGVSILELYECVTLKRNTVSQFTAVGGV